MARPSPPAPTIIRIVVRDLTEKTYGSAVGVGLADFVTQRLVDKLDHRPTYINCLTAMTPEKARIPMTGATDREAVEWAFQSIGAIEPPRARVVRIKNTLHPERFFASEALLPEIEANPRLRVAGPWAPLTFDEAGMIQPVRMPEKRPHRPSAPNGLRKIAFADSRRRPRSFCCAMRRLPPPPGRAPFAAVCCQQGRASY